MQVFFQVHPKREKRQAFGPKMKEVKMRKFSKYVFTLVPSVLFPGESIKIKIELVLIDSAPICLIVNNLFLKEYNFVEAIPLLYITHFIPPPIFIGSQRLVLPEVWG